MVETPGGQPGKPESPERPKGLQETVMRESAQRDARTLALLPDLLKDNINPRTFIKKACEVLNKNGANIKIPGDKDPLAPTVYLVQKFLKFGPEDDSPEGCDGKFGPYTLNKLITDPRFKELASFSRWKDERAQLRSQIGLPSVPPPSPKPQDVAGAMPPQAPAQAPQAQPLPPVAPTQTTPPTPQPDTGLKPPESKDFPTATTQNTALFGDSLTRGYSRSYFKINGQSLPTAMLTEYVKSGKWARTMRKDMEKMYKSGRLDNVRHAVVYGGANDIKGSSAETIIGHLKAMKDILTTKQPPAIVTLITLPPLLGCKDKDFVDTAKLQEKVIKINAWIRAQEGGNVKVVDLYNKINDPDRPGYMKKDANGGDGLHFSSKAYRNLANDVVQSLA